MTYTRRRQFKVPIVKAIAGSSTFAHATQPKKVKNTYLLIGNESARSLLVAAESRQK